MTSAADTAAARSAGFPCEARLLHQSGFNRAFNQTACKAHQSGFLLLACAGEGTRSRLGLVVAKRHLKRAHERNRIKRLARESFRQYAPTLPALDIVLVVKAGAHELDNATLHSQLKAGWQQLYRRWAKLPASPQPTA